MINNYKLNLDWLAQEKLPIVVVTNGLEPACGINSSATLGLYLEAKEIIMGTPNQEYRWPVDIHIAEKMIKLAGEKYGFKGRELELNGETKTFLYYLD